MTPELVAGLAAAVGLDASSPGPGRDASERLSAGGVSDAVGRTAIVNTLLDAVSPQVREKLLVEFLGLLQTPSW